VKLKDLRNNTTKAAIVLCLKNSAKHSFNRLGVSLEVLLKRILIAAVIGQLYAEKIPEI